MTANYTPGPREADDAASPRKYREGEHYFEIVAPTPKGLSTNGFNYSVADTSNRDYRISPEEDAANARLLAAAPEMAELLLSAYSHVSHGGPTRAEVEALLKKAGLL